MVEEVGRCGLVGLVSDLVVVDGLRRVAEQGEAADVLQDRGDHRGSDADEILDFVDEHMDVFGESVACLGGRERLVAAAIRPS